MIRIALVEDEAEVRAQLQGYVHRHTRQYGTEFAVTEFADGMELLDDYRPVYDILFLDVEMKHLDGMETARRVRELDKDVIIVFITNMAQYAIGGYAVGALDYVLKPVPYFAFSQQLRKAEEQLRRRARHYLALPVEGGMRRLDSSLIYYLESEGHRVHFYTEEGDFVAAGTLKAFEEKLADRPFARCNSGYLVNLAQVKSVQQGMVQVGPYELQVSRPRRKPSSRRWPTTSGVRVHDGTAQHPAPVYGAGRVSGCGHLRPAAGPPLRQNGHHRCQCGMGAGPECFLQATGSVPLAWWIPCMAAAVGIQYLYLWVTRTISLLEAGYVCARAFVLAELAASASGSCTASSGPSAAGPTACHCCFWWWSTAAFSAASGCWSISTKVPRAISSSAEKRPSWPSSWRRWSSR